MPLFLSFLSSRIGSTVHVMTLVKETKRRGDFNECRKREEGRDEDNCLRKWEQTIIVVAFSIVRAGQRDLKQ